jgi:hypothetical protein
MKESDELFYDAVSHSIHDGGSSLSWTCFFFFLKMGHQKNETLLRTVGGNTAHSAWHAAMCPTSVQDGVRPCHS